MTETAAQEKDGRVPRETAFAAVRTTPRSGLCRPPEFGHEIRRRSCQGRHASQANDSEVRWRAFHFAQTVSVAVGDVDGHFDSLPAFCGDDLRLDFQLLGDHAVEQASILRPGAVILLEEIAHDDISGCFIRFEAVEYPALIGRLDRAFRQQAADLVRLAVGHCDDRRLARRGFARASLADAKGPHVHAKDVRGHARAAYITPTFSVAFGLRLVRLLTRRPVLPVHRLYRVSVHRVKSPVIATTEGYGHGLAKRLSAEQTRTRVTRILRTADMAATEVHCDDPVLELSQSIQREEAHLVALTLRDFPNRQYWEDGRKMPVCDLRVGQVDLHDLRRDPVALLDKPYHDLFFYLPHSALHAIADDAGVPRVSDLIHKSVAFDDATISHLGMAMLPAVRHPEQANQLFVGHIFLALGTHLAQAYGGMRTTVAPARGGLAAWQEKRAKEMLGTSLDGSMPLTEVARECRLSVSHFSRAFRMSVGVAPHKWLLMRRIDEAKVKLRDDSLSLYDVAVACGFADQSHFTRVFTSVIGVSPGAWRRALIE